MPVEFDRTQVPYCQIKGDWVIDFSQCLYEWQSIIGGTFALIAAIATICAVWCQIRQADRIEHERITRQHNAVRMAFPFHLSSITTYIDKLADYFISTFVWEEDEGLPREAVKQAYRELFAPAWSDNIQNELSRLAETLTDVRHVKHLAELTSNIQIINSRIANPSTSSDMTRADVLEMIICCGRSKLLVNSLYNYMRFLDDKFPTLVTVDKPEEAWGKILKCCNSFVFTRRDADDFLPLFKSTVDRKLSTPIAPWLEKMN